MKRKFINNLLVIGCIAALMMTGCTKNNQTDTSTNNTVTDVANTEGTEVTDLEDDEVKESDDDKEAETETSEEPSNADEDTNTDNNESEDDSVKSEEDNNTDNEEVSTPDSDAEEKEEESQGGSTSNSNSSGGNSNTGNGGNNSSSGNGNNGNTGSNSGTGNNNSSSSGSGSTATTPAPHTHTYDSGVITRNASCTATGVKTFTCSCGTTYTETIPVTAHNFYLGYCTVCNAADPSYVETYTYEVVLEYGMIDLVNARRAECGYGALSWDSGLDETAKRRARELVDNFAHDYNLSATELITYSSRYMAASDCHTNYVNSSAHDNQLHKTAVDYISSATCYKKDSRGNVIATYNVILLGIQGGGSDRPGNGEIDPNPPGPDDIIW